MIAKASLREEILKKRNALDKEEILYKSREVFKRIGQLDEYRGAKVIMAYINIGSEVRTEEFIRECIETGKKVAIPSIEKKGGKSSLVPYLINDPVKDVEIGTYGIREPCIWAVPLEDNSIIDMVIVPGIVFGYNMHRIGYGKGYFDRFLRSLGDNMHTKVGVCFDMQLVAEIPAEPCDVPMDKIVTEKEIITN
jgi:5-formyltetrahydrofolate cyclo-ligase